MKAKVKGLKMDVKNEKGFTLLEVLVAGFILTIGLLGIAGMMTSAVRGNDFGKRMTAAENLVQERLEEFKNLSYNAGKILGYESNGVQTINICNGTTYRATDIEDYGVIADFRDPSITYPAYRRETEVVAANGCTAPPTDQTANVTVVVKWKGVTGEHSVRFMSMLAK